MPTDWTLDFLLSLDDGTGAERPLAHARVAAALRARLPPVDGVALDTALEGIGLVRARFGASMSRLETADSFSLTARTQLEAARSAIADTDVAAEAAALASAQVGLEATASLLAAANQLPGLSLSLLSG